MAESIPAPEFSQDEEDRRSTAKSKPDSACWTHRAFLKPTGQVLSLESRTSMAVTVPLIRRCRTCPNSRSSNPEFPNLRSPNILFPTLSAHLTDRNVLDKHSACFDAEGSSSLSFYAAAYLHGAGFLFELVERHILAFFTLRRFLEG